MNLRIVFILGLLAAAGAWSGAGELIVELPPSAGRYCLAAAVRDAEACLFVPGEAEPWAVIPAGQTLELFLFDREWYAVRSGDIVVRRTFAKPPAAIRLTGADEARTFCERLPETASYDDFMRDKDLGLQVVSGTWRLTGDPAVPASDNPFDLIAEGPGEVYFGREDWTNYSVTAALRCPPPGVSAGLKIGTLGFSVSTGQVVLADGKQELGRAAVMLTPGRWYAVGLYTAGDRAGGFVDGRSLIEKTTGRLFRGCPALTVTGGSPAVRTEWDDVRTCTIPVPAGEAAAWAAECSPTFRSGYLDTTAIPSASPWVGAECMWRSHREYRVSVTPYYGDMTMTAAARGRGPLTLVIHCRPDSPDMTGYRAVISDDLVMFYRGWEPLERLAGSFARPEAAVVLKREGSRVRLMIDDRKVVDYTDREPLADVYAAFAQAGRPAREIEVVAPRCFDYTFQAAPVDWNPVQGTWGVHSLWACAPHHTWYAALADWPERLHVLRYKRQVAGDFFFDFSTAPRMIHDQTPYYNYPWNIMFSLSPRPDDPLAGYVFLFGGPDLGIRVFKEGAPVAESQVFTAGDPVEIRRAFSVLKKNLHEVWYRVTVRKEGSAIEVSVDGTRLVRFNDNRFPEQTHAFFATLDCNAALGRVRVSLARGGDCEIPDAPVLSRRALADAEHLVYRDEPELLESLHLLTGQRAEAPAVPEAREWDRTWRNAWAAMYGRPFAGGGFKGGRLFAETMGGRDGVRVFYRAEHEGCVRVVKPSAGGLSALVLADEPFPVAANPFLMFDYRVAPLTSLGLMIVTERRTVFVDLDNHRRLAGVFRQVADRGLIVNDSTWRSLTIDLQTHTGNDARILKLALCDAGWQSGVRGGWYEIDNWCLVPVIDPARVRDGEGIEWKLTEEGRIDRLTGRRGSDSINLPVIAEPGFRLPETGAEPIAPPVVRIVYPRTLTAGDFGSSEGFGQAGNRGGLIAYDVQCPDTFNGRALNVEQAPFNQWESYLYLYREPFVIEDYPLVTIRYRPIGAEWWLGFNYLNEVFGIFDRDNHRGTELKADRAGLQPDGTWRLAMIDLRRAAGRYRAEGAAAMRIDQLFLSGRSFGDRGNPLKYQVDYFAVADPRTDRVRAEWTPLAGADYAWSVAAAPDAPASVEGNSRTPAAEFGDLGPGRHLFRLKTMLPDGTILESQAAFITEGQ